MEHIQFVVGDQKILQQMTKLSAWRVFDERIINFCGQLSSALLKEREYMLYPDLVTLAFWLRKSNVKNIQKMYQNMDYHIGKGLVFHIAPGNVALSFAYSLATGLLTGNTNVIRMPSRNFEQADIFCRVLRNILIDEPEIAQRMCLIRYPHDKSITDELSLKCHMRIIWGGNETVNTIRKSPIPPRATEITFANRFSICLIDTDKYLMDYDPKKTAHGFYIDTYLSDQNACSSPRIIFWHGKRIDEAKRIFWNALYDEIREYNIAPVTIVDKLMTFCKFAAENPCKFIMAPDCKIMRIEIDKPRRMILDNIGNSGFFYECEITELDEILPICTWELQTLSYIGFDKVELSKFILSHAPDGVDRIVPVGSTMDFSLIWDGRDVVREMTREIASC